MDWSMKPQGHDRHQRLMNDVPLRRHPNWLPIRRRLSRSMFSPPSCPPNSTPVATFDPAGVPVLRKQTSVRESARE